MVELNTHLNNIYQALADPTRRAILAQLTENGQTVGKIAKPFHISLAAVSKHLKVLERARLIEKEKRGSSCYISLNTETLMTAEEWLRHYRGFWEKRLDALKHYLENETDEEN